MNSSLSCSYLPSKHLKFGQTLSLLAVGEVGETLGFFKPTPRITPSDRGSKPKCLVDPSSSVDSSGGGFCHSSRIKTVGHSMRNTSELHRIPRMAQSLAPPDEADPTHCEAISPLDSPRASWLKLKVRREIFYAEDKRKSSGTHS